jgi:uncharacterized protein YlxW (UPF0749 family)
MRDPRDRLRSWGRAVAARRRSPQEGAGGEAPAAPARTGTAVAGRAGPAPARDRGGAVATEPGPQTGAGPGPEAGPQSEAGPERTGPGPEAGPERAGPEPEEEEAAAAVPVDGDASAGRTRLRRAFMRPSRAQVLVGVLLAGLGFAAVTQVRSNDLDNTYASYRQQDLIDLLNSLSGASQRAQREIARLERTRDELLTTTSRREAAVAAAEQAEDNLQILAGTVPVEGPGLRITVTEAEEEIDLDHVLDTVQELRTAQAEAMEFNDSVRVVASTSFSETVGGLAVDGVPLEPPYTLDVIGEPDLLSEALVFPLGPLDQLRSVDGATVEVDQLQRVEIDSVVDPEAPEYAQPAPDQ